MLASYPSSLFCLALGAGGAMLPIFKRNQCITHAAAPDFVFINIPSPFCRGLESSARV